METGDRLNSLGKFQSTSLEHKRQMPYWYSLRSKVFWRAMGIHVRFTRDTIALSRLRAVPVFAFRSSDVPLCNGAVESEVSETASKTYGFLEQCSVRMAVCPRSGRSDQVGLNEASWIVLGYSVASQER
jgi:hypothetical protein